MQVTEDRQAIIEQVRHRAHANFSAGFNCAECVTEAVWALIQSDLPPDAWKLATGFGGGIGLYGDTCGALTGAILAVGAVHGRGTLPKGIDRRDILTKSRTQLYEDPGLYRIFNQLPNWFVTQYGTTLCREITTAWRANWLCLPPKSGVAPRSPWPRLRSVPSSWRKHSYCWRTLRQRDHNSVAFSLALPRARTPLPGDHLSNCRTRSRIDAAIPR